MPEEFEGDLAGSVFWGADLSRSVFRDVDLTGISVSHARLVDVDIDANVDRVVINGVDVTAFVNEHDRWYPLRSKLGAATPDEMRQAWAAFEAETAATLERALRLPDATLHRSVDGEFSYVQTLRHLVFAIDKWFTVPILGERFDPIGLPNTGSLEFPWPGLDLDADPSASHVIGVRADRNERLRRYLADVEARDLERDVDVPENGPHRVAMCVQVVFEEEFWHNRYALRDLERLEWTG